MKSKILSRTIDTKAKVEARLIETEKTYAVGVFDLDAQEYYPPLQIYPKSIPLALEKATEQYAHCKEIYEHIKTN